MHTVWLNSRALQVVGITKEVHVVRGVPSRDLVVPDRNLFDTPLDEISETQVLMTLLDGEVVHCVESWID
jgi:predicted amidohydrolase YtcJ